MAPLMSFRTQKCRTTCKCVQELKKDKKKKEKIKRKTNQFPLLCAQDYAKNKKFTDFMIENNDT